MQGDDAGSIWPAPDEHAAQVREVYARYGLAMYHAQVLEHGAVNALAAFHTAVHRDAYSEQTGWASEIERVFETRLAQTFGGVLKALENTRLIPDWLMFRLRTAKDQRDHLAHRFFRLHDFDLFTPTGRRLMIKECEEIISELIEVDRELDRIVMSIWERYGLTQEIIDRQLEAMRAGTAA